MLKNTDTLTIEPYSDYTGTCTFAIYTVDSDNYTAFHDGTYALIDSVVLSAGSSAATVNVSNYERFMIRTIYNTNVQCNGTILISN